MEYMRRPTVWEASRLDLLLTADDRREALSILGHPMKRGRKRLWYWESRPGEGAQWCRFTIFAEAEAEALWMRFGGDPRLVDCLRNMAGSPSRKFVERYTHWIDAPFADIRPIIEWARANLPRHLFAWGGETDRWMFWAKTDEVRARFEAAWPHLRAGAVSGPDDMERFHYVRAIKPVVYSAKDI